MQGLVHYLSQHPSLAIAVVFAAALLESAPFIGTVIPGSSIVLAAGVLIGLQVLDPWGAAAAAVLGAILGDGLGFWLGHHYHSALRSWGPLRTHPQWLARGEAYFAKRGGMSVFLGRFLGPVRAIVPVVAGMSEMSALRFTAVNVASAFAWAAAHLLPGALFGASLQIAGAVSSRLFILLAGVGLCFWLCAVLLRLARRGAWPIITRQRDRIVAWAQSGKGLVPRVTLSLLDPARPESPGLLAAALALLGGAWLFFGILEDVATSDALVQFDRFVFTTLQALRTGWIDNVMIAFTELGSAAVAISVIAAVALVLAFKRRWRTLAYWLSAMVFSQALVWILKMSVQRARPTAMYEGTDAFSFPSGHAASSIVLYAFLAFLLTRGRGYWARLSVVLFAAGMIAMIAFSRLYLGAHWLSDVLASLSLGTAWVALLSIAYTHHAPQAPLPARALTMAAVAALVVAGAAVVVTHHARDLARYAPRPAPPLVLLADWRVDGWQQVPPRRTEMDGDYEEPLSVQWAGSPAAIAQALQAGGWQTPPPWTLRSAMVWLLPSATMAQLPVLAKLHRGAAPTFTFEKPQDSAHRSVLRLWPTLYQVADTEGAPSPLWSGMVTMERLEHPAGMATFAVTDQDSGQATAQLAKALRGAGVRLERKPTNISDVLLVR